MRDSDIFRGRQEVLGVAARGKSFVSNRAEMVAEEKVGEEEGSSVSST